MATQTAVPAYIDDSAWERINGELVQRRVPGRRHAQAQGGIYFLL